MKKVKEAKMKTKDVIIPLLFLCIFSLYSCAKHSPQMSAEAETTCSNPPFVYSGIDGSMSYNFLEASKDEFRNLINYLPPAASVCFRWITHDSYNPNNAILNQTLPAMELGEKFNPFDRREKIRKAIQRQKLDEAKKEILMKINRIQSPQSNYTDIYGFLVLCSERIKQINGREVYIIISSDLKNNVNKYLQYLNKDSLQSSHIFILAYEHTNPEYRIVWTERFKNWGAKDIRFFAPDEEMPNLFERSFIAGGSLEKNREKREQ